MIPAGGGKPEVVKSTPLTVAQGKTVSESRGRSKARKLFDCLQLKQLPYLGKP